MRTPQQAIKDAMPAIIAFGEGRTIQIGSVKLDGSPLCNWDDLAKGLKPDFCSILLVWRPKPEPKPEPKPPVYRPWTRKEIPLGASVKDGDGDESVIVAAERNGIDRLCVLAGDQWKGLEDMLRYYVLINADGTESPCGVEVPNV